MKERLVFVCYSILNNINTTRYQRATLLAANFHAAIIYFGDIPDEVRVNFRTSYRVGGGSVLSIVHSALILAYLRLFKGYKIIHTQYILNAVFLGYVAKRLLKMTWIYDLWDHPSLEYELNTPIKKKIKQFVYERVTRNWLPYADIWIICMHHEVLKCLPAVGKKTRIIKTTNGIDGSVVDAIDVRRHVDNVTEKGTRLKLSYAGAVILERGIALLIDTLGAFPGAGALRIDVFGVTNDTTLKALDEFNVKNNTRINYLGLLSHNESMDRIAESDICLCILDTSILNYRYAYPIKIFEYLAMGKVVIATHTFATTEIIQNGMNGFLVSNDVAALGETLDNIIRMWNSGKLDAIRGRARDSVDKFRWGGINQELLAQMKAYLNKIEAR